MKKIFVLLTAILCMASASFAQDKKTKAAPAATTATKLKKDGTPDMRTKENKAAAVAKAPVKKDGTPDMRFKANKDKKKA